MATPKPEIDIKRLLAEGHTLRQIEDQLDWLENAARDAAPKRATTPRWRGIWPKLDSLRKCVPHFHSQG